MNAIASYLPPKVRLAIYTILGVLTALEAIWNVLPDQYDGKVLATFSALGFAMAAVNATPGPPLPPPRVPEDFDGEFA